MQNVQEELRTIGRVSVENMDALNRALGVLRTEVNQLGMQVDFRNLFSKSTE
ncbi:hypothetical protein [Metabacillus idriensis]|uniref:hypothetical protein n=1 Tax=Metabacillus idriensis TaxID=324768 RepID=UPI001747EE9E|nr:hypothetical protein [Metabacillus idriensis]